MDAWEGREAQRASRQGIVFVVALLPWLGSCGDGGGGGGSTPALNAFEVETPRVSPARLRFDASQAVRVALFYEAGAGEQALTQLLGSTGNEVSLPAGESSWTWDFAAELGDASFRPDVRLVARFPGGPALGGGELRLDLGNDAPVIEALWPPSTVVSGVVPVGVRVRDSSADFVSIRVEWKRTSEPPDAWRPATPAGAFPGGDPFQGVAAPPAGVDLSFFWNTDAPLDLHDREDEVVLRFTPDDGTRDADGNPIGAGEPAVTAPFQVDNNEEPIVQLDSGALLLNSDERRGIPIPFRVFDEEGDRVHVIFQWRREGEDFPSLDLDGDGELGSAELDALLDDPRLRRERRVCTPYPHFARGRVVAVDEDTVRLSELARSESWILSSGIEGGTLELLRASSVPSPITPSWRENPLLSPLAALPIGDGLTALLLDGAGTGRLREIVLATGAVVREIAALGPGIPSAMTLERGGAAVLVALDEAGSWRIQRVELATGALTELVVSDGTEPAPVRGLASLGTDAAVFTAGAALFHLDYREALAPRLGRLLSGLATPWGVVADPLPPDRIYVSERDANRVLAIELDAHGKLPVVVDSTDVPLGALAAPEALALERNGARMLIVTTAPGGGSQLLGLDLGATGGNVSFPIGAPTAGDVASMSTGPDGLRLLCLPRSDEILVAGGIEQRRVITAHATSTQDATVEPPFDPAPRPGETWRLAREVDRALHASAQGLERRFVWDSADAYTGSVLLRVTACDDEVGLAADGAVPKRVRGGLEVEPLTLGGLPMMEPWSVTAADLDGDGDEDVVSANRYTHNLTVFFQLSPGSFGAAPLVLGGPGTTEAPNSVAAADLDGDGDRDLLSANVAGDDLTVFFQVSPGSFGEEPLRLGGERWTAGPWSATAADLDADGDQDIVSANVDGNDLTIFFQSSPGSFAVVPLRLGGLTIGGPFSAAAADLDGDGDQDIVSANGGGSDLTVFFQLSPGRFDLSPLRLGGLPTTIGPWAVAAADLDGDGDQDIVSGNWAHLPNGVGSDLTIFFQLSPGCFAVEPLVLGGIATTDQPVSVAVADLDGDGDQDLATANAAGDDLTVFQQLSPGSFAAAPLRIGFPPSSIPSSVAASDLDGDGDQDLVSATGTTLTAFLQSSPGSFRSPPLTLGGYQTTNTPASIAAADLDGDGDLDLVSANSGDFLVGDGNDLTIFFQLSPGSFATAPLELGGPPTTNEPRSVAVADLDGDGDQDIVSTNGGNLVVGNDLTVFFQLSPGSFAAAPLVLGGIGTTGQPVSVAAADLDGDGDLDLVSANLGTNGLTVFAQSSPGSFSLAGVLGNLATTRQPVSVATADLDGDGDQDVVSANHGGNNLAVFLQSTPGSFSAPLTLGSAVTTGSPSSVAAADLDQDGDLDLVSANQGGSNLAVFFQLSRGSFTAVPLVLGGPSTTSGPSSVVAVDLDRDGDQDLVSANQGGSNLTLFFQHMPGRFAAVPFVLGDSATTSSPSAVVAADIDGDGEVDLVSANADGHDLTLFLGGR